MTWLRGQAKIAWQHDRPLVDVTLVERLDGAFPEATLRDAFTELKQVSETLSDERKARPLRPVRLALAIPPQPQHAPVLGQAVAAPVPSPRRIEGRASQDDTLDLRVESRDGLGGRLGRARRLLPAPARWSRWRSATSSRLKW